MHVEELQINGGKVPSLPAFRFPNKIFPAVPFWKIVSAGYTEGGLRTVLVLVWFSLLFPSLPATPASGASCAHHRAGAVSFLTAWPEDFCMLIMAFTRKWNVFGSLSLVTLPSLSGLREEGFLGWDRTTRLIYITNKILIPKYPVVWQGWNLDRHSLKYFT